MKRLEALEKLKLAKELIDDVVDNYEEERCDTETPGVGNLALTTRSVDRAIADLSCENTEELVKWSLETLIDLVKEQKGEDE